MQEGHPPLVEPSKSVEAKSQKIGRFTALKDKITGPIKRKISTLKNPLKEVIKGVRDEAAIEMYQAILKYGSYEAAQKAEPGLFAKAGLIGLATGKNHSKPNK